jgi:ubiquinone/menaquinone biosynthesis C-methylase UbiE
LNGLIRAMSEWDKVFDELYLRTYAVLADPETGRRQAEGVARLVGLEPGADVLDCPCGYGRHSIEFARLGFHVVGSDRSEVLLAEAKRRAADGEWPQLVQADYRELPFEDSSFDCVTNLFTSLGFWGEEGDRRAIGEFRRVLRPGGTLVIEIMHRDRLMAIYQPKSWEELPDGSLMVEQRTIDYERGMTAVIHELVEQSGNRIAAQYEFRVYTATELIGFVHDAGFEHVSCYGDFDETPLSRDTRLVLVAS